MSEADESKPAFPEIPNALFNSNWELDSYSLERMRASSKPMSLTDLKSKAQEWVSFPLSKMLAMPPANLTILNIKNFWEENMLIM